MILSRSVQLQLRLLLFLTEIAEVGDNSNSTLHREYEFSIVFPHDLYANQKDTSLRTAATEFHHRLLLLANNCQEYREAVAHWRWLNFFCIKKELIKKHCQSFAILLFQSKLEGKEYGRSLVHCFRFTGPLFSHRQTRSRKRREGQEEERVRIERKQKVYIFSLNNRNIKRKKVSFSETLDILLYILQPALMLLE